MTRQRFSLTMFVWLLLVWFMLWGSVDPFIVLTGVVVALGVLLLFPLPTRPGLFVRPLRLLRLVVFVVADLTASAFQTAWFVLRYGRSVREAVLSVPVLSERDHAVVAAANMVSLTPGKFVLQIDRARGIYYVYALGVRSAREAARAHDQVLELQIRVVEALGSAREAATVRDRVAAARRAPAKGGAW
ncbi:Na+/H+ antiporter subunit E [Amycolatopsis cihanbeyliensis]|uniref:Multisubunit sodium/proton antiporter MrpE subunit n=1 Tax=Amycolatopsis cihanbeyliensis TaxID=1128664 RepID=A0A542DED9_AMYCI|nr:Na+/H+ antiporter subunit E [Amycolatopsis cihanbeyliensis]TQJ01433.1 multisubunit sodium/proton antiporter MrpE subunit [Amycolatopsis cihanbeyliensis]